MTSDASASRPCPASSRAATARSTVPAGAPVELDGIWLVVHRDVQRTARVRVVIEAQIAQLAEALTTG